jgi:hypothetical protein
VPSQPPADIQRGRRPCCRARFRDRRLPGSGRKGVREPGAGGHQAALVGVASEASSVSVAIAGLLTGGPGGIGEPGAMTIKEIGRRVGLDVVCERVGP